MVVLLEPYTLLQPYSCTPADRLDARLLHTYCFTLTRIMSVM